MNFVARDEDSPRWVALDIGGANIKAAHESGQARTVPFEVWKRPEDLGLAIASAVATLPAAGRAAVTMTAELCDCYPTKVVGVNAVLDAVIAALPGWPLVVWGVDGELHDVATIRHNPKLAAASNWLALATLAARLVPDAFGILIDVGSTTTDLIPLDHGEVAATGHCDTERLRTGELVYAGVRRTPICALATELEFQGGPTGLAAELFASTLDVYLTLGHIEPDPDDLSTADGRPATVDAARDRLARMIGADRDSFSVHDALVFAHTVDECLMQRLAKAAWRTYGRVGMPTVAVTAGSGEFLARRVASRIFGSEGRIVGVKETWGEVASSAGCAFALAKLAAERRGLEREKIGLAGDLLVEPNQA